MERVGKFEKVSFDRFNADIKKEFSETYEWAKSDDLIKELYDNIQLPVRATKGSAGYDFKAPFDFTLMPGQSIKIPTGIRVMIDDGWWLACLPRSSLGMKYRMQIDNTIPVVDADYYYSKNEGHIFIKITNGSSTLRILSVSAGDGFVQAIFLPYGITYDDDVRAVRDGGMGSTGR